MTKLDQNIIGFLKCSTKYFCYSAEKPSKTFKTSKTDCAPFTSKQGTYWTLDQIRGIANNQAKI